MVEVVVQLCSIYIIKLVIVDVSDGVFDFGVFFEAKSFGMGFLNVEVVIVSLDGLVVEGCVEGLLIFSLFGLVELDYLIDYQILGLVENGVDYVFIFFDLFIFVGDSMISILIIVFEDGIDEGEEIILIDVQWDFCNCDIILIFICENLLILVDLGLDVQLCFGDSLELMGELLVFLLLLFFFISIFFVSILANLLNVQLFFLVMAIGVILFMFGLGVI